MVSNETLNEQWDEHQTQEWKVGDLRDHPENVTIFGVATEAVAFLEVRDSIKRWGLQEPLVIKADGTILSGHIRKHALLDIYGPTASVRVRVHPGFSSYREEVEYIIDSNTKRRQLTMRQKARAFRRLIELPVEEGGERRKRGRPTNPEKGSAGGTISPRGKTGAAAAKRLGIGKHEAAALDVVFNTPGISQETQDAVECGAVKPTVAAQAIKAGLKPQGRQDDNRGSAPRREVRNKRSVDSVRKVTVRSLIQEEDLDALYFRTTRAFHSKYQFHPEVLPDVELLARVPTLTPKEFRNALRHVSRASDVCKVMGTEGRDRTEDLLQYNRALDKISAIIIPAYERAIARLAKEAS
jgi:hypothetical protein